MKKYQIFPALNNESFEGWIWTNDDTINGNNFITIRNPLNGKKIRTFKRTIDPNFIRIYRDGHTKTIDEKWSVLVISDYYREKLCIGKGEEVNLIIEESTFIENFFLGNWNHPNPYISQSNKINVTSLALAILAILLTIWSLIKVNF